jgi:hypothetical protein
MVIDPNKHSSAQRNWEKKVSSYLLLRKKLHVLSFQDIANRLKQLEISQSPKSLSQKFNTGKLKTSLFLAILSVLGDKSLDIDDFK